MTSGPLVARAAAVLLLLAAATAGAAVLSSRPLYHPIPAGTAVVVPARTSEPPCFSVIAIPKIADGLSAPVPSSRCAGSTFPRGALLVFHRSGLRCGSTS